MTMLDANANMKFRLARMAQPAGDHDVTATDPPLLQQNSVIKPFTTSRFTYPGVRVFYRRHPKLDELPTHPAPLPLLVFIHGLGGSVAQFHGLLTSLHNIASCLAVDLPGCGRSQFAPPDWEAYSVDASTELLWLIIDQHCDSEHGQGVVLVGHSMGTAIAARLANKHSDRVVGIVGICPISGPQAEAEVSKFRKLLWVPDWLFSLWRAWDQWGGPESASVRRFVGHNADLECKKLQYRFNQQSRTPVFRRMAWGCLPIYVNGKSTGGLFGEPTWAGLDMPVFLIGAENDNVTSPKEVDKIKDILDSGSRPSTSKPSSETQTIVDSAAPVTTTAKPTDHLPESISSISGKHFAAKQHLSPLEPSDDPVTPYEHSGSGKIPPQPPKPKKVVRTQIMPAPATHAVLFAPKTDRILSALISDFLSEHITGRFDLGWQLQHLSREGKWDVKNLAKWKAVEPVSAPIHGIFRAMKTLREVDEVHSPKEFSAKWGGIIKNVIDISHDNPAYDPRGLERQGIRYHKFATVSKIPPTDTEVDTFIALVDRIREEQKGRTEATDSQIHVVGVHCHYGFNRTGYFIVCYLVDRCALDVEEALDVFAKARPNGIRHSHFKDHLYIRYSDLNKRT